MIVNEKLYYICCSLCERLATRRWTILLALLILVLSTLLLIPVILYPSLSYSGSWRMLPLYYGCIPGFLIFCSIVFIPIAFFRILYGVRFLLAAYLIGCIICYIPISKGSNVLCSCNPKISSYFECQLVHELSKGVVDNEFINFKERINWIEDPKGLTDKLVEEIMGRVRIYQPPKEIYESEEDIRLKKYHEEKYRKREVREKEKKR